MYEYIKSLTTVNIISIIIRVKVLYDVLKK